MNQEVIHPPPATAKPTSNTLGYVSVVCLVLCFAGLVAHATHFDFINDDAFISFRYADNLVRHGELTFNPGERVEGYTNFLWTVIIAGVIALGGDPVAWSKGLGIALSCLTLGALYGFTRRWEQTLVDTRSPLWRVVAPAALAGNAAFACWSEGGLETALFTTLTTVGVLGYIDERRRGQNGWFSGVALALAAMARPEGLLVLGLCGLHTLATQVVERRFWPERASWVRLGAFLGVFAPYWIWRFTYYGYVFPNTFYAKGDGALWGPGLAYVGGFVADTHVWLVLPLVALPLVGVRAERLLVGAILAVAVPYLVYVARVGGDFMALYRFLVPLLPLLYLLGQEGLASLWQQYRERAGGVGVPARIRVTVAAVALSSLFVWQNVQLGNRALEVGSTDGVDSIGWLKLFVTQTTAIGKHLRDNEPPDTSIATTAAGVIPYYSRLETLDLLALNDVYTAHNVKAHGGRPGHAKSAPESYVLKRAPTILLWHPRMSKGKPSASATERRYWKARGYEHAWVKVEGLEPPYWSYFKRVSPK